MENIWLSYAKRLQAIASTGISFSNDEYDRERYEEVLSISLEMMSILGSVPIERIEGLLTKNSKGYVTPKIDVRGAVFNKGKILLVQEKSDGLWTLPGGFADVGLSAAQNVEKEIEEEAGVRTTARQLYSIRHKSQGAFDPDVRDFYKLYFICEKPSDFEIRPGIETIDARFFNKDEIPPLSTGRVLKEDLMLAWKYVDHGIRETYFER